MLCCGVEGVDPLLTMKIDVDAEQILSGVLPRVFVGTEKEPAGGSMEKWEEEYALPHVLVSGKAFWACSRTTQCLHTFGRNVGGPLQTCYENMKGFSCSFRLQTGEAIFQDVRRQEQISLMPGRMGREVWDSAKDVSADALVPYIRSGVFMWSVMLDGEDVWNVHPVEARFWSTEQRRFALRTPLDSYPISLRYPLEIAKVLDKHFPVTGAPQTSESCPVISVRIAPFSTFYVFYSDGSYYNYYDIPRGTVRNYKRLRLYISEA